MFVKERFVLYESTKDTIRELEPDFGYNGFGELVFYRTYSRVKVDGSCESWNDVVIRVTEGVFSIRKDWFLKNRISWNEKFWQEYASGFALAMFDMKWLPPGRGLWAMGTDYVYERGSMALQNCGFVAIRNIANACHWLMDALMNGVGVGFSPERTGAVVFEPMKTIDHTISDDKEGWCDSVKLLIQSYTLYNIPKPIFDYGLIRPAGAPIKGFGGVSSGPDDLKELHGEIENFFEMYLEKDWYDEVLLKTDLANTIGCCVVAGNVRRSAELAAGSINDDVFMNMKDYKKYPYRAKHGWMSNNSVFLRDDSDFEKLGEIAKRVIKNGEPGYINLQNLPKGRIGKNDNVKPDEAIGFNPCLPGSAIVCTKKGLREFKDIKIGDEVWSKEGWTSVINKFNNGVQEVYKYITTAGTFYGTENHKIVSDGRKIEVRDAESIDSLRGPYVRGKTVNAQAIVDGLMIGDGTDHHGTLLLNIGKDDADYFSSSISDYIGEDYNKKYQYKIKTMLEELPLTYNRKVPDFYLYGGDTLICSFLRGLYSANGSICGNRVTLKASSFKLIEQVQLMLSSVGIKSYFTTNKKKKVEFKNGEYECKESYDLNISTDRGKFCRIIGFIQKYKQLKLEKLIGDVKYTEGKRTFDIIGIEKVSEETVYDITVDNCFHTFWCQGLDVSNCGEQPLENHELCCLAESLPTRCEGGEEWLKSCEYATVYASTVTLLPTHRPETNAVMFRNRRIGVGIVDFTGWIHEEGANKVIKWLRKGYNVVGDVNRRLNAEAGVPEAIRKTTMKPGGTTPKLPGKQSGCGYPTFRWIIRRILVAESNPVATLLIDANVPYEPHLNSKGTLVFEWPILQGPAKPATEASIWEQAFNLVTLQREWSDNAVSNTLYFKKEEEGDIEAVLSMIAPLTKSVSLLPHTEEGIYPQMPEQGITEEEYNQRLSTMKKVDWSKLRNKQEEELDKYCDADHCEIA